MKKLLFIAIVVLFSCEETEQIQCWECVTVYTSPARPVLPNDTAKICDVLIVAKIDGTVDYADGYTLKTKCREVK